MKKLIIIFPLLVVAAMTFGQFTSYVEPQDPPPTLEEKIAALSNGERNQIINAFEKGKSAREMKQPTGQDIDVLNFFEQKLEAIEHTADTMQLRYDYNNIGQLSNAVHDYYSDNFSQGRITYILNRRVHWFQDGGGGNFTYYRANIGSYYGIE